MAPEGKDSGWAYPSQHRRICNAEYGVQICNGPPDCPARRNRVRLLRFRREDPRMSKFSKAFMSLFLDQKARDAMELARHRKTVLEEGAKTQPGTPPTSQPAPEDLPREDIKEQLDAKLDEVQNRAERTGSPSRQALIQNAMRVRAQKQDVLSDLSDEQRLKLQVLALKAMMPPKPGERD